MRGWVNRVAIGLWILVGPAAWAGLCTFDKTTPGLPKASCQFPSCPEGIDCQPPTIDKPSATIEYREPLMKWSDTCPDRALGNGPCWEVYVDFKAELLANDTSGVNAIGIHLAQEVSTKTYFKKYVATVTKKNIRGKYEMEGTTVAHVPPGQRLDLRVFELCARDGRGNEGCVLPITRLGVMHLGQ